MAYYELGEAVVNRDTLRVGTVVDAADSTEDGTTESVEIQYEDGGKEWVSINAVSKLLLEVDPPAQNKTNLQE
jgi:hypothetical protein